MVSIIIPNYNRADLLTESIQSIIKQSYKNWEIIIVDDGSTDKSFSIIQKHISGYENIHWLERTFLPKGAPSCRNEGLYHAKGEYIIFLDSDDILASHCLEQRVKVMESHPELDFAVFPMLMFNQIPDDSKFLWNIPTEESNLKRFWKLDAVWQTTAPIWKKGVLKKIKGFNETLKCWQDVDIHLRALHYPFIYKIFENYVPDVYYRKDAPSSISQQNMGSPEKLKSRFSVLKNNFALLPCSDKGYALPMLYNVLIASLNIRAWKSFYEILKWKQQNHLRFNNKKDALYIFIITVLKFFKLERSVIKKFSDGLKSKLLSPSTIGKFKYGSNH